MSFAVVGMGCGITSIGLNISFEGFDGKKITFEQSLFFSGRRTQL